jgi:hypothetical protein
MPDTLTTVNRAGHPILIAPIDIVTATTTELIAAPAAGTRIRILRIWVHVSSASNTVEFLSGSTGLFGAMGFHSRVPLDIGDMDHGCLVCGDGESFSLVSGHASQMSGVIHYLIEPTPAS